MSNKPTSKLTSMGSVIVTSALPYSNGEIHLGHIASTYLPADIFSRYLRLKGLEVYHLCASDDFGTPILIKAEKLGKKPEEYVRFWHERDKNDFDSLGISFNFFSRTSSPTNIKFVRNVYLKLLTKGHIYQKDVIQYYCQFDSKFLPDRYVIGKCPFCEAEDQYSDLCEKCGRIPDRIVDPKCSICGRKPVTKKSTHEFFKLSQFSQKLETWLTNNVSLQTDVKKYVLNWIHQGLKDWDITRDISWGISLPGLGDSSNDSTTSDVKKNTKVFYGWFDNHLCYISTLAEGLGSFENARTKWNASEIYHFIGKDIAYHHYLFLPAIRLALDQEYKLPDFIPTRGHLLLANQKISKSRNWYVSLGDFISSFEPDYLRFYLASIISYSQDDVNFDWDAFEEKINSELINNIGNFINRTLSFCKKYFGKIPQPTEYDSEDRKILAHITTAGKLVGNHLAKNEIDKGLKEITVYSSFLNKYFQTKEPWKSPKSSNTMLFVSLIAVKSLAIMLFPYTPYSAQRIWEQLGFIVGGRRGSLFNQSWDSLGDVDLSPGSPLGKVEPIFKKIEHQQIRDQKSKFEVAVKSVKN